MVSAPNRIISEPPKILNSYFKNIDIIYSVKSAGYKALYIQYDYNLFKNIFSLIVCILIVCHKHTDTHNWKEIQQMSTEMISAFMGKFQLFLYFCTFQYFPHWNVKLGKKIIAS